MSSFTGVLPCVSLWALLSSVLCVYWLTESSQLSNEDSMTWIAAPDCGHIWGPSPQGDGDGLTERIAVN